MSIKDLEVARIKKDWAENPRWLGVRRGYTAEDVYRLRGSLQVEHTLARRGSEKLWKLMHERAFVNSLGAPRLAPTGRTKLWQLLELTRERAALTFGPPAWLAAVPSADPEGL